MKARAQAPVVAPLVTMLLEGPSNANLLSVLLLGYPCLIKTVSQSIPARELPKQTNQPTNQPSGSVKALMICKPFFQVLENSKFR